MRHVNLYRRGSTLWWRRRLPAGTVRLLHRREIRVSTRTHLSTEAIGRAARLRLLTDALFEVLERAAVDGLSPTPEVMNAIVRDVIARELDMAERARALRPALDHAAADALASGAEARIAQLRDALRRNDLQAAAGPVAAAAKRLGFAIDPNSDDGRILQRLVLRGLIQVTEENHRREQGEYRCDAELFLTRPTNAALAVPRAAAPTLDLVLAPRRLPGMPGPAAVPPQPPSLAAALATIVVAPLSSNGQPCSSAASSAPPAGDQLQAAFGLMTAQKREDKSWGL